MKARTLALLLVVLVTVSQVMAQGPLSPPGAPAPMMKTLEQIESRTPISSVPYMINQPGSYYVTTNLTGIAGTNGISIVSDDVTLDLNGYTVIGVPGSDNGIEVVGTYESHYNNIAIRNGTVRNWGGQGIKAWYADNSQVTGIRSYTNGYIGISIGEGCVAENCTAGRNSGTGICVSPGSTVNNCAAIHNSAGFFLINGGSTIRGCTARNNTGCGMDVGGGSTVIYCTAEQNGTEGIYATRGSTITDCTVKNNSEDGIFVIGECRVVNNTCHHNGDAGDGAGIHLYNSGSDNRIEGNNVTDNDRGIDVDSSGNLIIRNSASGNTTNYDIVAGNKDAQVLTPGSAFVSTDPWANFSF